MNLRGYALVGSKSKQLSRRALSSDPQEYDLLLESEIQFAPMKISSVLIAVCLFGVGSVAIAAEPSKETDRDQQQVIALSNEVQGQQKAIAENQAKIDEKMAGIAEVLRLAK